MSTESEEKKPDILKDEDTTEEQKPDSLTDTSEQFTFDIDETNKNAPC